MRMNLGSDSVSGIQISLCLEAYCGNNNICRDEPTIFGSFINICVEIVAISLIYMTFVLYFYLVAYSPWPKQPHIHNLTNMYLCCYLNSIQEMQFHHLSGGIALLYQQQQQ